MKEEHPVEYYMYKPIAENPIVIDFSAVRYYDELYELLKKKFGLPEYCGDNLDALWDCLSLRWMHGKQAAVELHGVFSIRQELQPDMDGILDVFSDVHRKCPGVTFVIKS
ncbi:MAG: barstar family protein [Clostridia bacterium]|nr:barstar family protein [Clostridia bacterium]